MARHDRIVEALREEVSIIIHDDIKDPRLGFVTITKVELAPDKRFAKIFYSVLGNEDARNKTKEALDSSLGFVRKLVGERINLRFVPELMFDEDRSQEYSSRIEEILNEIKESEAKEKHGPKKNRRTNKKSQ
ncbi:MAG: 30S ribosome-binding factor RbfA [Candidatus Omnitrophota bacterium]